MNSSWNVLFYQAKQDFLDLDQKRDHCLIYYLVYIHEQSFFIKFDNVHYDNYERLVNIELPTSQTFSTMMGTCADISQYLCKELAQ